MVVINSLILIGITYLWYVERGAPAALCGFLGLVVLTIFGSHLPWYVILPMVFWLTQIIRNWHNEPEPKISDTNQ